MKLSRPDKQSTRDVLAAVGLLRPQSTANPGEATMTRAAFLDGLQYSGANPQSTPVSSSQYRADAAAAEQVKGISLTHDQLQD